MAGSIAAESAICGLISLRFARGEGFLLLDAPISHLGFLERRLALWWEVSPRQKPRLFSACFSPSSQTGRPGAFLRGGRHPLPDLLDTPSQVCLPHRHSASFIAFLFFHNGSVYQGYRFGFSAQFGPASHFRLGEIPPIPPRFDGSADRSKQRLEASVLQQTFLPPTKGAIEEVPRSDIKKVFFSAVTSSTEKGRRPETHSGPVSPETSPFTKGSSRCWRWRRSCLRFKGGLVRHYRPEEPISHPGSGGTGISFDLPLEGAYHTKVHPFGLALAPRTFTKCMDAALAPWGSRHSCAEWLDDWLILAHSRELVSRHRDIVLHHIHLLASEWTPKDVLFPSQNCGFWGSLDYVQMQARLAPARVFQFRSMSGPLQARPSCLSEHLPQVARLHGSGLPCAAPRVAPHEAVPLVMKVLRLHPTVPATRLISRTVAFVPS